MGTFFLAGLVAVKLFALSEGFGFKTTGSVVLGEYVSKNATTGKSVVKTYYLSKFLEDDWMASHAFCKNNGMTLAAFSDKAEMENFIKLCNDRFKDFGDIFEAQIGGFTPSRTASRTNWYWYETGEKINYDLPWHDQEPSNNNQVEQCMSVIEGNWGQNKQTSESNGYYFNDCQCYSRIQPFICQEIKPL